MIARVFVDTNVLIYARDLREDTKRPISQKWLEALAVRRRLLTNLQVLNELAQWLLRNERTAMIQTIQQEIALLAEYGHDPLDADDVERAWDVRETLGYQWFDCLLLASAANAGCTHFLSEDMGHETRYGSLTIINPFRVDPDSFLSKN